MMKISTSSEAHRGLWAFSSEGAQPLGQWGPFNLTSTAILVLF